MNVNMSLEIHFLLSQLDIVPVNLGDVSDEQGEHFRQDFKILEDRDKIRVQSITLNLNFFLI